MTTTELERARYRKGRPPQGAYRQWAERCDSIVALAAGLRVDAYARNYRGMSPERRRDWRVTSEDGARRHADAIRAAATVLAAGPPDLPSPGRFRALVARENEETSDGRIVDDNALTWRTPPLPFMFQRAQDFGHMGSVFAGWFDTFTRDGLDVWGEGPFDGGEDGVDAARIVRDMGAASPGQRGYGVSMDVSPIEEEVEITEVDEEGWPIDGLYHLVQGLILGATATPFPAIASAYVEFVQEGAADGTAPAPADQPAGDGQAAASDAGAADEGTGDDAAAGEGEQAAAASHTERRRPAAAAVVAGAAPVRAPVAWFADPEFGDDDHADPRLVRQRDGRYACPLTVTDDGRIFGHLARWGQCHIGYENECVTAPPSNSDYAHFRRGNYRAEGEGGAVDVAVGTLTFDTGHADRRLGYADTIRHYDDSGTAGAYVVVGEDAHGVWYSGALRPDLTPEQVVRLRALGPSGDWRDVGGDLDLVAGLLVNVQGFPIVRMREGRAVALVAAGRVERLSDVDLVRAELAELRREVATLRGATSPLLAGAAAAVERRMRATIGGRG